MQATGEFDGGKITEQKPIGFPGEGSVVKRVGPLFYWAWGVSSEEARIGLHPHKGFEIMTYVVEGDAYHGDTLGTDSRVGAGGAQVMQTGSGVSHEERLAGGTELFQIWFEPDFMEAIRREPTYRQYEHEEFPLENAGAYTVKTVIGPGAPIELVADVEVYDVEIQPGAVYTHPVPAGYTLTALAIRGQGTWTEADSDREPTVFHTRDFLTSPAASETAASFTNTEEEPLRLALILVPTTVPYALFPKH
ncbi:pirin family protein [Paenibacillus sp. CC-CFT747]|nr:pirin family protein [Paenibacillus sp. CC-CFT747]